MCRILSSDAASASKSPTALRAGASWWWMLILCKGLSTTRGGHNCVCPMGWEGYVPLWFNPTSSLFGRTLVRVGGDPCRRRVCWSHSTWGLFRACRGLFRADQLTATREELKLPRQGPFWPNSQLLGKPLFAKPPFRFPRAIPPFLSCLYVFLSLSTGESSWIPKQLYFCKGLCFSRSP